MKALILESVQKRGTPNQEYVLLRVNESCDLGHWMVADTTYIGDAKVSNKVRHTYWIPDAKAQAGDTVLIYTGIGTNGTVRSTDGRNTIHFFYWGLKTAVWNNAGDAALLFDIRDWQSKKV